MNKPTPISLSGMFSYDPFGMTLVGRNWVVGSEEQYRFGFNGYENTDEILGDNIAIDFGARVYDSRLGRFLSVDPLNNKYPWQSCYVFAHNSPIVLIDFMGMGDPPDANLTDKQKMENRKDNCVALDEVIINGKISNLGGLTIPGTETKINPLEILSNTATGLDLSLNFAQFLDEFGMELIQNEDDFKTLKEIVNSNELTWPQKYASSINKLSKTLSILGLATFYPEIHPDENGMLQVPSPEALLSLVNFQTFLATVAGGLVADQMDKDFQEAYFYGAQQSWSLMVSYMERYGSQAYLDEASFGEIVVFVYAKMDVHDGVFPNTYPSLIPYRTSEQAEKVFGFKPEYVYWGYLKDLIIFEDGYMQFDSYNPAIKMDK